MRTTARLSAILWLLGSAACGSGQGPPADAAAARDAPGAESALGDGPGEEVPVTDDAVTADAPLDAAADPPALAPCEQPRDPFSIHTLDGCATEAAGDPDG